MKKMHPQRPALWFAAVLALAAGAGRARGNVDLEFRPDPASGQEGSMIEIGLYAVSDDATDQSVGAMDVILNWDPSLVELVGVVNDGDYPWLFSGFPDDSGLDGLNNTFLDGDALYTAFAQFPPNPPASATPSGLHVVTFRFRGVSAGTSTLEMPRTFGEYSRTAVYDGYEPAVDVTGQLRPGSIVVAPDLVCFEGTVNLGAGSVTDVLFLDGSTGGATRTVFVAAGDLVWAAVVQPPCPLNGKYVVTANLGSPDSGTETVLPAGVGTFCFPLLLQDGADSDAVWNNVGKVGKVGASKYFDGNPIPDPPRAPALFLELWGGDPVYLPAGTSVTFQGVIMDGGAVSAKRGSATNAVLLRIL